jgi:cytochrome d ubiquinol oxidase subunit II
MLIKAIEFFLVISIIFYCLFAGADFGAGMIEIFLSSAERDREEKVLVRALGPVWEANHMWLVLAVVILFMGFPRIYVAGSITYHIPLTIMLFGIILRGCAFTFRHYDAVRDQSHKYYTQIFIFSSFLAPFMLGTVAGSVLLDRFNFRPLGDSQRTFESLFISPWCNLFSFSIGIFTCVLFIFLASVYLIGEVKDGELRLRFIRRAKFANIFAVLSGALVFLSAQIAKVQLAKVFADNQWSLFAMLAATLTLVPLWICVRKSHYLIARAFAAMQVFFVLIGWMIMQLPYVLSDSTGPILLDEAAAGNESLKALLYALLVGSLLIFPALFYLFKIFKSKAR